MNYLKEQERTESKDFESIKKRLSKEDTIRLLHAGMGLTTESGEFVDVLKKHIFYGKSIDLVNLAEEAGDIFWYLSIVCNVLGVSFESVQEKNIAKLRARYPEKFTEVNAEVRDLDKERKILEDLKILKQNTPDTDIKVFLTKEEFTKKLDDTKGYTKVAEDYVKGHFGCPDNLPVEGCPKVFSCTAEKCFLENKLVE